MAACSHRFIFNKGASAIPTVNEQFSMERDSVRKNTDNDTAQTCGCIFSSDIISSHSPMTRRILLAATALTALGFTASATTYLGNGNTGFGGAIGTGSLTLTDNGTTVTGTITRGSGNFNDALVIYIDSVAGGFSDTSGFSDNGDGLRSAISGFSSSGRSLMTFQSGFLPDYAIALGPSSDNFGGLWQLASGGANSLPFISSVNLSPTGTSSASTYTFSFNVSQIGLTPNSGQSFELFGTYISDSAYRSTEAIAGNDSGTQGWNSFNQTGFGTYTIEAVPEPSTAALATAGGLVALMAFKRRK